MFSRAVRVLLPAVALGIAASACGSHAASGPPAAKAAVVLLAAESAPVEMNTEAYDRIDENPFIDPRVEPLSTFGVDVDTASYANTRRFLLDGSLPPPGAVRIEELINYFDYSYPAPDGELPFSVTAEVADCPWREGHSLLHVGLKGRTLEAENVPPRNLVFLLDVSGSMGAADKLPLVQDAMKLLARNLRSEDSVAIVVYAGASGLVLPASDGDDRAAILEAIDSLGAGGSTNGGEGIELAYDVAQKSFRKDGINRVILATDGDFNVGVTNRSELTRLIEEKREGGVYLTVLGVGRGNLQDSQMEELADRGNGNYHYLDSISEARKVLVQEAGGTLVTIAKDVKVQVEFNPAHVGAYRLIGYENRLLRSEDFEDDEKDAGEIGAGHTVTALYEIAPPDAVGVARDAPDLKYQERSAVDSAAATAELLTVKLRYKEPDGDTSRELAHAVAAPGAAPAASASESFRFSAAVASFGMLLRGSAHCADWDFARARELAESALGDDPHGYRAEFVLLTRRAADLVEVREAEQGTR
jgi:Ca-activated chloride channel family protein